MGAITRPLTPERSDGERGLSVFRSFTRHIWMISSVGTAPATQDELARRCGRGAFRSFTRQKFWVCSSVG